MTANQTIISEMREKFRSLGLNVPEETEYQLGYDRLTRIATYLRTRRGFHGYTEEMATLIDDAQRIIRLESRMARKEVR